MNLKRALSLLLLSLIICMALSFFTAAAFADDPVAKIGDDNYDSLEAAVNAASQTNNDTIVLLKDVTLTDTQAINKTCTLDLNGHSVTMNAGNDSAPKTVISITGGAFTLTDSGSGGMITHTSGKTGHGVHVASGAFNLTGGTISGNSYEGSENGGGVYVDENATFTMSGGTISGNTASNNSGDGYGGGVFVRSLGTFNMTGGTISNNTGYDGGGVYVAENAEFTMSGDAKITGNTSTTWGGGVDNNGIFNMSDNAEITGNTANTWGGGVLVWGNFNIAGSPVITGNKCGESDTGDGKNVALLDDCKINVTGPLTSGAQVAVTTAPFSKSPIATTGIFTSGDVVTFTDSSAKAVFFSDKSGYYVHAVNGQAALVPFDGILYVGDAAVTATGTVTDTGASGLASVSCGSNTVTLTLNGFHYDGAGHVNSDDNAPIWYEGNDNLTLSLNGTNSIINNDSGLTNITGNGYGVRFITQNESSPKTLTFSGNGSLEVGFAWAEDGSHNKLDAIYAEPGFVVLNGPTVNATGGVAKESVGIYASSDMTVSGGTVNATGADTYVEPGRGVWCNTKLTVSGGTLNAVASTSNKTAYGIDAQSFIIRGGTVAATGVSVEDTGIGISSSVNSSCPVTVISGALAAYGAGRYINGIAEGRAIDNSIRQVPSGYTIREGFHSGRTQQVSYPTDPEYVFLNYVSITAESTPEIAHAHDNTYDNIAFRPWTPTNRLPSISGNYYLTDDVTLSDIWNVNGTVNLCLNGKTITGAVNIPSGKKLNLYDCSSAGVGTITSVTVADSGTFNMYGGTITGAATGVTVADCGTFNMHGGTITGNTTCGVNVGANGTFTVSGIVNITGNGPTDVPKNVYLPDGCTIGVSDGLNNTSRIGVTTATLPTEDAPVTITSGGRPVKESTMRAVFHIDSGNYFMVQDSSTGEGQFVVPVAEMDGVKYGTLKLAFNEVPGEAEKTITLLRDVTVTNTLVLRQGQAVILNLGNYRITGPDKVIENDGSLKITADSTGGITTGGVCAVSNSGSLTVNGGTYKSTKESAWISVPTGLFAVDWNKSLEIKNITAESRYTVFYAQYTTSSINAENCTVTKLASEVREISPIFWACGPINVNGGTYTSYDENISLFYGYEDNPGEITVTDGTFIQTVGSVPLIDYAQVTISGGKFSAGSLATARSSVVTISGGKYTAALASSVTSHLADGYGLYDNPDSDAETYPKAVLPGPRIVKNSLVLDGVLDLKYYLSVPEDFDGTDVSMTFSMPHRDNQVVLFEDSTSDGDYRVYPCHVYAYQMAEPITATITWVEDSETQSRTDTYSVKDYLDALSSDPESTAVTKNLVEAIRNYGHYVQPYLTRLGTVTYGEDYQVVMPKSSTTDVDVAAAADGSASAAGGISPLTIDQELISNVWMRLNVNSGTDLVFEFKLADGASGNVTASVDSGEPEIVTLNDRGVYRIEKQNIAANNLEVGHTFEVHVGDAEEAAIDIGASALNYINMVLHNASAPDDEKAALAALYEYWAEADDYA